MCWTYRDDEGNKTLIWYQGVVDSIVRNKSEEKQFIEVMKKWNENCIEEEDLNPTQEMLKKNDYNTDVHCN